MSSAVRVAKRSLPALLALLALSPAAAPLAGQATTAPAQPAANPLAVRSRTPPIRVTLSEEDLVPGDRVRVLVRPRAEGYLVVLHADPAGRVRVLFPLDPGDDQRVPGAVQRSIPSRDGSASFVVASSTGDGAVLAAVSNTRFRVASFASGGHWNVRAFPRLTPNADPEGELVAVAGRMAGGARFDYAVAPYRVSEAPPVVVYGRGGGADTPRSYADDTEASPPSSMAAGVYYYDDAYVYGYPPFYAGLFPAHRWPGLYSPCGAARGRVGAVARGGCFGGGRVSRRWRHPSAHFPDRGNGAPGDLSFPGNPSFGEPRPFGDPVIGPRAVAPPSGAAAAPRAAPATGGMVGVPARPLPGVALPPRQQSSPAAPRRPSSPRMP
jgi:hypothetical protein